MTRSSSPFVIFSIPSAPFCSNRLHQDIEQQESDGTAKEAKMRRRARWKRAPRECRSLTSGHQTRWFAESFAAQTHLRPEFPLAESAG